MDDIIRMAREAWGLEFIPECDVPKLEHFASLVRADERKQVAAWMMAQGYATGHGDTMEQLLEEFEREIGFDRAELWIKRINEAVLEEREQCARACDELDKADETFYRELSDASVCAATIRART